MINEEIHEHNGIIEIHWSGLIRSRCIECGEVIYLDRDQLKEIINYK